MKCSWVLALSALGLFELSRAAPLEAQAIAVAQQAIIVGNDDRVEPYTLDEVLRRTVLASTAALLDAHRLLFTGDDGVALRALPASQALDLCPDEPFAAQPAAAFCSGVLIDEDLVATAGHCLGSSFEDAEARCASLRVAFGYQVITRAEASALSPELVFSCRRVVAFEREQGDYAVIQLERPTAAPLAPVEVAEGKVALGDRLTVASYPAGLPLKVEERAIVLAEHVAPDSFVAETDTFAGSSGGPLLDAERELVGLVAGGRPDWVWRDGCKRAVRSPDGHEQHQYADSVAEAVCASGWPSARLCGARHACGDGLCGGSESLTSCPRDCPAPVCGDRVCEASERAECVADCHLYDGVSVEWAGDPAEAPPYFVAPPETASEAGCSLARGSPHGAVGAWSLVLLTSFLTLRGRRSCCRSSRRSAHCRYHRPSPCRSAACAPRP